MTSRLTLEQRRGGVMGMSRRRLISKRGRRKFTPDERRRGTLRALRSRKTPVHLKPGLGRYAGEMGWLDKDDTKIKTTGVGRMAKRKSKRGRAKAKKKKISALRKKGLTWKQIGRKLRIAPLTAWWVYHGYKRKGKKGKGRKRKGRGKKARKHRKGRKKLPARATTANVKALRKQGLSWAKIGKRLRISDVTAWRIYKKRK